MRGLLRVLLVGCLLGSSSVYAAVFYRLTPVSDYDLAGGVSPDGRIVLTTEHVWTPEDGFVRIAPGDSIYSRDISNNGFAAALTDGSYLAARVPVGGAVQELGAFPGGDGYGDAYGITPDGNVVVGYASSADGHEAFRWTSATGLVGLGHLAPGNHFSDAAYAVSADGSIIAGEAESAQGQQAFRWTQPTGMVGLGDLPGGDFNSFARGISSDGQVIVGASTSTSGIEAFRWTQATGMVGLGDLPGGDFYSTAYAATADGSIIVGESRTTLIDSDAFIWTSATGMRSLQEVLINEHGLGQALAGWRLSNALISDDGNVIVGTGRAPSGRLEGFVVVIPEPGMICLFIAVAAVIMVAKCARSFRTISLAILCMGVSLVPRNSDAATFYRLGTENEYDLAKSVSPDGSLVLVGRYVWTPTDGFVDYLPGVSEVYGGDLANGGIVAGMYCGPNTGSCYEAYRAPVGGPVQGLGTLGGTDGSSYSFAISPDGSVVVGYASSPTGVESFRWTQATGMVGLGHLFGNQNSHDVARGLSADGSVIVGQSGDDTTIEAFRWTAATGMVGLGDLPGGAHNSFADVVSADGSVIAGTATTASGTEAFRWTQATGMVGLGGLNPTALQSAATAISADGSTIYGVSDAPGIYQDVWVWTEAEGMRNFQDVLVNEYGLGVELAGWRLWNISDVSADGLVLVGNGHNPAGELEGFAIVIPEPSALLFGAAAFALVSVAAFRRRARPFR
jgi:probable HAF family extracellular repeat protein